MDDGFSGFEGSEIVCLSVLGSLTSGIDSNSEIYEESEEFSIGFSIDFIGFSRDFWSSKDFSSIIDFIGFSRWVSRDFFSIDFSIDCCSIDFIGFSIDFIEFSIDFMGFSRLFSSEFWAFSLIFESFSMFSRLSSPFSECFSER